MMRESELCHLYQAWQQGNEHYVKDWFYFVQWAANKNTTTTEKMLEELKKYKWFECK